MREDDGADEGDPVSQVRTFRSKLGPKDDEEFQALPTKPEEAVKPGLKHGEEPLPQLLLHPGDDAVDERVEVGQDLYPQHFAEFCSVSFETIIQLEEADGNCKEAMLEKEVDERLSCCAKWFDRRRRCHRLVEKCCAVVDGIGGVEGGVEGGVGVRR